MFLHLTLRLRRLLSFLITNSIVAIGGKLRQAQHFGWTAVFMVCNMLVTAISPLWINMARTSALICAGFACGAANERFIFVKIVTPHCALAFVTRIFIPNASCRHFSAINEEARCALTQSNPNEAFVIRGLSLCFHSLLS